MSKELEDQLKNIDFSKYRGLEVKIENEHKITEVYPATEVIKLIKAFQLKYGSICDELPYEPASFYVRLTGQVVTDTL